MEPSTKPAKRVDVNASMKFSIAFLIAASLLYRDPSFFIFPALTYAVALFGAGIGIIALGSDLARRDKDKSIAWDDLGVGLVLAAAGYLIYRLSPWPITNLLAGIVILFGLYGTVSGVFDVIYRLMFGNLIRDESGLSVGKIFVFILQVIALIAGILQSLQILRVIR